MTPPITLLTDFGLVDTYVGQMRGVILGVCPGAPIVDLTHAVEPQNILHGAVLLADAVAAFPPETIHVAVVDPGVGTARRAIAAEIGPWRFVAPDNGLLTGVLERWECRRLVELARPEFRRSHVSATFHGRDVFAAVAAHWARGIDLSEFGPARSDLVRLPWPRPIRTGDQLRGQVLYADRFGNLITNILQADLHELPPPLTIEAAGRVLRDVRRCYGDVALGEWAALVGSSGRLEIVVNGGSAAQDAPAAAGTEVVIRAVATNRSSTT